MKTTANATLDSVLKMGGATNGSLDSDPIMQTIKQVVENKKSRSELTINLNGVQTSIIK